MATQSLCPDDPATNLKNKVCVNPTSKNLKGTLKLKDKIEEKCDKPLCVTFKTIHELKLKLVSHQPCDSPVGKLFSADISIPRLITVFNQNGMGRGFHAGDFTLTGLNIKGKGSISGMTNVGTHRRPVFDPCQRCGERGVMEGRICIQIGSNKPETNGCQLFGVYRIKFDPTQSGGEGAVSGVIEGVIICPCK